MIAEKNQGKGKNFHYIYNYIREVWGEKEMRAKKAKDELVKQEEIIEERERRKQQQKQAREASLNERKISARNTPIKD
jgi:hypothetical protein